MKSRLLLPAAAVLLALPAALSAAEVVWVIDTLPSGRQFSEEPPVLRGEQYVFHRLPDGALVSMRRADVRRISEHQRRPTWARGVVEIADLPMEGGNSSQAGPHNAGTWNGKTARPSASNGFYGNVVPGVTEAFPNSIADYQVGRTWAAPPPNASIAAPGALPRGATR
jgi:hypothetical protein